MANERKCYRIFVLGTAREDTVTLLTTLKSLVIEEVILYNGPGANQAQLEAELICQEMNILGNCLYTATSEISEIKKADISILWGYCFPEPKGENLVAVKRLLIALTGEISPPEACPVFLFPDGMSGIMYANILHKLLTSMDFEEPPVIRVISSISLLSHSVFGPSEESACAWPTAKNQFFIQAGDNEEKDQDLDFYLECMKNKQRPRITEAVAMAESTKLIAFCANNSLIDREINKRMKIVGRTPTQEEANEVGMEEPYSIVFLRADHSSMADLDDDIKQKIQAVHEEVKRGLSILK